MFANLCKRGLLKIYFSSTLISCTLLRRTSTSSFFSTLALETFSFFKACQMLIKRGRITFFFLFCLISAGANLGYYCLHSRKRSIGEGRELICSHLRNDMCHITIDLTVCLHLSLREFRVFGNDVDHAENRSNSLTLNLHFFVSLIDEGVCLSNFSSETMKIAFPIFIGCQAI